MVTDLAEPENETKGIAGRRPSANGEAEMMPDHVVNPSLILVQVDSLDDLMSRGEI